MRRIEKADWRAILGRDGVGEDREECEEDGEKNVAGDHQRTGSPRRSHIPGIGRRSVPRAPLQWLPRSDDYVEALGGRRSVVAASPNYEPVIVVRGSTAAGSFEAGDCVHFDNPSRFSTTNPISSEKKIWWT
ncbi:MAG TPA: hypothetical protein VGL62_09110 [Vicinamibacterales bacterium]